MKKRQRDAEGPAPPPSRVNLDYSNLPRQSLTKLQELLTGWAKWHRDYFVEGYIAPETCTGSIAYCPSTMDLGSLGIVIEDKPQPTSNTTTATNPAAAAKWFNISYEKAGDVPLYNRCTDITLQGGNAAAGANAADAARLNLLALVQQEELGAGGGSLAGRPAKRLKQNGRCFNCGSYGHSLRECWKQHNQTAIDEARRGFQSNAPEGAPKRYHHDVPPPTATNTPHHHHQHHRIPNDNGSSLDLQRQFPDVVPGKLTAELRYALGMGHKDPPPWYQNMLQLGLPPSYMTPSGGGDVGVEQDQVYKTVGDKIEEEEEEEKEEGEAEEEEEGEALVVEEFISLNDLSSSKPTTTTQVKQQPSSDTAQLAEDFIPLVSAIATTKTTDTTTTRTERCCFEYPGVNAPLPDGADVEKWQPASVAAPPPPPPPVSPPPPLPFTTPPPPLPTEPPPPLQQQQQVAGVGAYWDTQQQQQQPHQPYQAPAASGYQQQHQDYYYHQHYHQQYYQAAAYTSVPYYPPDQPPPPPPQAGGATAHYYPGQHQQQQQQQWQQYNNQPPPPPPLPPPPPPE